MIKKILLLLLLFGSEFLIAQRMQYGLTTHFGNFGVGKHHVNEYNSFRDIKDITKGYLMGLGAYIHYYPMPRFYIGIEPSYQIGNYRIEYSEWIIPSGQAPELGYQKSVQVQSYMLVTPLLMGIHLGKSQKWLVETGVGLFKQRYANKGVYKSEYLIALGRDYSPNRTNILLTNRVMYKLNHRTSIGLDCSIQFTDNFNDERIYIDILPVPPQYDFFYFEFYRLQNLAVRLKYALNQENNNRP